MKAKLAALLRNPKFWASLVGLLVAVGLVAAADEAALIESLQNVAANLLNMLSMRGG